MAQVLTSLVAAFGLLAVLVAAGRGQARAGLHLALTFWMAAGLLRLSVTSGWGALAGAAAVLAVRQVVSRALR